MVLVVSNSHGLVKDVVAGTPACDEGERWISGDDQWELQVLT